MWCQRSLRTPRAMFKPAVDWPLTLSRTLTNPCPRICQSNARSDSVPKLQASRCADRAPLSKGL